MLITLIKDLPIEKNKVGYLSNLQSYLKIRKAYTTYSNQNFSCLHRVILVSVIREGLALDFWMKLIDGRAEYPELRLVLKTLEPQFNPPAL